MLSKYVQILLGFTGFLMMAFGIGSSIIILLIVTGVLNLSTIMSFWILFGVLLITGIIIFSLSISNSVVMLLRIIGGILLIIGLASAILIFIGKMGLIKISSYSHLWSLFIICTLPGILTAVIPIEKFKKKDSK